MEKSIIFGSKTFLGGLGPRTAKTTQSERQERPQSVPRALFSKIQNQGCGSQPSRTLYLLWQTDKMSGPPALKRRLFSHLPEQRASQITPSHFPPLRNPPMMLRRHQPRTSSCFALSVTWGSTGTESAYRTTERKQNATVFVVFACVLVFALSFLKFGSHLFWN